MTHKIYCLFLLVVMGNHGELWTWLWSPTATIKVVGSSLFSTLRRNLHSVIRYFDLERYTTTTSCKSSLLVRSNSKNSGSTLLTSWNIMWKCWQIFCVLLHLSARSSCQKTALDSPFNVMFLRALRNWSFNVFGTFEQRVCD